MSASHGQFVWYELMTTDLPAAERFYAALAGWTLRPTGFEGAGYTMLQVGEAAIGGILALPAYVLAGGARPAWIGYIGVDDVDASQQRVLDAGGAVHRPAWDIPQIGRLAVVADPQGAPFVLFKGNFAEAPPEPGNGQGTIAWRELLAGDWASAFDFYASLFGWGKGEPIDMGPMGTYQLWGYGNGESVGGMMTRPPNVPSAFWAYYIRVDNLGAAIERAKAGGGSVFHGPSEVPGGDWIAQGFDPQGALFSLVSATP